MPTFGPGSIQFGEIGSEIDVACLVNSLTISMSKDQADDTTKLCGTVKPGKITYTYALGGNLDIDPQDPEGIFMLSQNSPGTQVPFTYVPNTEDGTTATGIATIDPLDFGGDEYGADMTSDFEWAIVGKPTYTAGTGGAVRGFQQLVVNGRRAKPEVIDQPLVEYDDLTKSSEVA